MVSCGLLAGGGVVRVVVVVEDSLMVFVCLSVVQTTVAVDCCCCCCKGCRDARCAKWHSSFQFHCVSKANANDIRQLQAVGPASTVKISVGPNTRPVAPPGIRHRQILYHRGRETRRQKECDDMVTQFHLRLNANRPTHPATAAGL
jgi:hypothetical protein